MLAALAAHPAVWSVVRLAADDPDDSGESKKSGPIGLVVIIVLCVACYFLFKSMSKHLRSVREGDVPVSSPTPPADGRSGDLAEPGAVAFTADQEPAPPA
jgi:hypothetical protein